MRVQVSLPAVGKLLLLLSFIMALFVCWHTFLTLSSPDEASSSGGKVHVLLLSSWRSGSSFLGEVFNQHPSVFYLMEPAWHVWARLRRPGAHGLRMAVRDLMHRVFLCDMSVLDAYMPPRYNISHLFMWSHSRALCSVPACLASTQQPLAPDECQKRCVTRGWERAEEACRSKSHVVLKEVRFFELESLFPLLQDPTLDLRILHLVRDPRAVFRSREQAEYALHQDSSLVLEQESTLPKNAQLQVMQKVCRSHIQIHETATDKAPDFLKGRYKLVRYEDIARDPLTEIKNIYDFVGLEMTTPLMDWIYRITHGKGLASRKEAFKITERNAADVSQAWRTSLSYEKVKQVQDVCKSAMTLLRYRIVNSENEQKQLDLDLTRQEKYSFAWLPSDKH